MFDFNNTNALPTYIDICGTSVQESVRSSILDINFGCPLS